MEHESIRVARQATLIAQTADVSSEAGLEATQQLCEAALSRLRLTFVGGQEPNTPKDWRIDGLTYRVEHKALSEAIEALPNRHRAAKWAKAQRFNDRKREQPDNIRWGDVPPEMGLKLRQAGFKVRVLEIGRTKRWQVGQ